MKSLYQNTVDHFKQTISIALILALVLIGSTGLWAQNTSILQKKITVTISSITLGDALLALGDQAGCTFSYSSSLVDTKRKLALVYSDTPLIKVLEELLGDAARGIQVQNNGSGVPQITIKPIRKTGRLKGALKSTDGELIPYASVRLKGTKYAVITDTLGDFVIKDVPAGQYTLLVSALGYKSISKTTEIKTDQELQLNLVVQSDSSVLDEVTVTGNRPVVTSSSEYVAKMPLDNMENAQVYTGITNALIVQQKIYNVNEAIQNVPGITISYYSYANSSDYGGSSYTSRGFATKTSVLNGMALKMYSSYDAANLEKIEVIKGPSATLFGNIVSSYGGLINRVTKKPYDHLGGSVDMAGGSFGFRRVAIDINNPLSKDKTVLARLNAAVQNQGNFQDNGGFARDIFIAPSFTYRLSDRVKVNLNTEINYSKSAGMPMPLLFTYTPSAIKGAVTTVLKSMRIPDATIAQVIATAPSTMAQAFGSTNINDFNFNPSLNYGSKDLEAVSNSVTINPEVHYTLSNQWKSVTAAIYGSSTSSGYNPRLTAIPNMVPAFLTNIAAGKIEFGLPGVDYFDRGVRKYETSLETHAIQQNFVGDFNIGRFRNRMVVGADYYHRKTSSLYKNFAGSLFGMPSDQTFDVIKTSGPVANYYKFYSEAVDALIQTKASAIQDYSENQSVYSAFVNDVFNVTSKIIVSAGLRLDRFDNKGKYNAATDTTTGYYKQTALAPKLGLLYQPLKDKISIFGNYQTSFTNQEGTNFRGESFRPEQAFQWEGGVKTSFFDGHFTSTLSYYDITVNDKVRMDLNNPNFRIQDGNQISRGFEAEVLGNPVPELNILLGYAYNNSKMVKSDVLIEGLRPVDAGPEHQFNFWLHYHFNERTSVNGLSLGFGGNYSGKTLAVNYNPDGSLTIPAYTLLNAKISYDRARYSFSLRANNLMDQRFWRGISSVAPQMPRQLIVSLAIKL